VGLTPLSAAPSINFKPRKAMENQKEKEKAYLKLLSHNAIALKCKFFTLPLPFNVPGRWCIKRESAKTHSL
jgi:hypothetical protein